MFVAREDKALLVIVLVRLNEVGICYALVTSVFWAHATNVGVKLLCFEQGVWWILHVL